MIDTLRTERLVARGLLIAARDALFAIVEHPDASRRDRLAALVDVMEGVAAGLWPLPDALSAASVETRQ